MAEMDIADPAAANERLKVETAAMLSLDPANLSLTQGLQLDLVSLLRLEVDTMQGKVLAGETVDRDRLVTAHAMLQKMLPAQALVAPASEPEARFGDEHRRKLRDMIQRVVFAGAEEEAAALADACEREERVMQAEALGLLPASEPVTAAPVRLNDEVDDAACAATRNGDRTHGSGQPAATALRYLRGPRESWRDHAESGNVVMPVFPRGGGDAA
jgi:hypothetical protein